MARMREIKAETPFHLRDLQGDAEHRRMHEFNERARWAATLRERIAGIYRRAAIEEKRLAEELRRKPREQRRQEGFFYETERKNLKKIAREDVEAAVADILAMDNGTRGPGAKPGYVVGIGSLRDRG